MNEKQFMSPRARAVFETISHTYDRALSKRKFGFKEDKFEIIGTALIVIFGALFVAFASTPAFSTYAAMLSLISLLATIAIFTIKVSSREQIRGIFLVIESVKNAGKS